MDKESRKKVRISELNFKNIGDRITFIRLMDGKTVEEFSSIIGISKGNLSDLENSKNKPSYEVIASIAESFNVNSEWIISGKGRLFKRVYNSDSEIPEYERVYSLVAEHFSQRDLAMKIITDTSKIGSISSKALIEVADYVSGKLKYLMKYGERRGSQRRDEIGSDEAPEGCERRSGKERRSHETYRK